MRQAVWLVLGLILCALGATGGIRLLVNKDPGALRHLPGGYPVQLGVYVVVAIIGLRMAQYNRVQPDPRQDRHR
jgi:hypothetical protein